MRNLVSAIAVAIVVVSPLTATAQFRDALKRLKEEVREVREDIGDNADEAVPETPASQTPNPSANAPNAAVAPVAPPATAAPVTPAPAQPESSSTTGLSGRWKYVYYGPGTAPRSIIGSDLVIQESGSTWTMQLAYATRILASLKCSGGGSACVVVESAYPNLACTSTAQASTLGAACVWDIYNGQARYTYTFERSGPNIAVTYRQPDGTGTDFVFAPN